jgi:hypothetical protein
MDWRSPVVRCGCGHVGRPALTEGTSRYTLTASCLVCRQVIKQVPKLRAVLS